MSKRRGPARARTSFNTFPERAPEAPRKTKERVRPGGSWWLGLTPAQFAAAARERAAQREREAGRPRRDDDEYDEAGA